MARWRFCGLRTEQPLGTDLVLGGGCGRRCMYRRDSLL